MHTLRSPKDYTGPDLDLPSLECQAWPEATYGMEHWQMLEQIRCEDWAGYLGCVRDTIGISVRNETEVVDSAQVAEGLPVVSFRTRSSSAK